MNSRERIINAINHKETDIVPLDLGATPSSGISAIAYNNLIKYLGISNSKTLIYDVVQELAEPEEPVLEMFNIDVIDVGRTFNNTPGKWYPMKLSDGSDAYYPEWFKPRLMEDKSYQVSIDGLIIAKKPAGATFYDQVHFPYMDDYPKDYTLLSDAMNTVLWQALAHSPWDHASEEDFWERLRKNCLDLKEKTDKALMIVAGCNLFEWGTFLRRIDNFLMDLYTQPAEVEKLLDALMEKHLATLDKICNAVGDLVDIIRFGDDLGMDNGPFMDPDIYRTIFKPRHKVLCDYVKSNSGMYTFLHSCGSIYSILPDLIEAGYDIINPVQTNTRDMEPDRLKKEFGKDITFWGGGIDTRSVLNNASPEKVKDQVKERLDIFMPGGGFVFNTVHNILSDVPPENIVAMFEAISEYK